MVSWWKRLLRRRRPEKPRTSGTEVGDGWKFDHCRLVPVGRVTGIDASTLAVETQPMPEPEPTMGSMFITRANQHELLYAWHGDWCYCAEEMLPEIIDAIERELLPWHVTIKHNRDADPMKRITLIKGAPRFDEAEFERRAR